jgi:hypothetical protein
VATTPTYQLPYPAETDNADVPKDIKALATRLEAVFPTLGLALPSGVMCDFAGAAAPAGWLLCDGSAVSRNTYANLFAAIGTTYGAGDGSSTFNLPDGQGRMMVGKGTQTDVSALGNSDGVAVASRSPKHGHANSLALSGAPGVGSLALPNHGHGITDNGHTHAIHMNSFGGSDPSNYLYAGGSNAGVHGFNAGQSGHLAEATATAGTGISVGNPTSNPGIGGAPDKGSLAVSGAVGVAGTVSESPAYLVVNRIIKT